jgi:hypothetical protein
MNLEQINKIFAEVINRPGIYHQLNIPKNNVAQYRWKLKRGIHITVDKKLSVLQRAGYNMQAFEWTDKDLVDAIRFALRQGDAARQMGAEYLFEKWKNPGKR